MIEDLRGRAGLRYPNFQNNSGVRQGHLGTVADRMKMRNDRRIPIRLHLRKMNVNARRCSFREAILSEFFDGEIESFVNSGEDAVDNATCEIVDLLLSLFRRLHGRPPCCSVNGYLLCDPEDPVKFI